MLIFPFFFFLLSFESECSICCFNIFSSFAKVLCPEKALLWVHCDSVSHGVMWSYPVWCVLEFQSECEVIKEADNGSRFLTVFIWKWSKVGLHVQILGLDFGYSFTLLDWLCTCTMCSLRSDSMPTEPLFFLFIFIIYSLFSWCAWEISLLKESYWRVLFPNDLWMFLLLLFSFRNVVSEAL